MNTVYYCDSPYNKCITLRYVYQKIRAETVKTASVLIKNTIQVFAELFRVFL